MRSPCVGRAHGVRQLVPFLALVLLGVAAAAHADALKCTRTVAKASAAFAQAKVKALQKCDDQVLRHTIAGPCPDGTAAAKIAKAESKLRAKVSSDCGGSDHVCGTGGDEALGGIGWGGGACPNLEQGSCGTALTDCNGISDCLACVDEAAVDQAIGLYYGSADPDTTNSDVVKCQRAIGKYTTRPRSAVRHQRRLAAGDDWVPEQLSQRQGAGRRLVWRRRHGSHEARRLRRLRQRVRGRLSRRARRAEREELSGGVQQRQPWADADPGPRRDTHGHPGRRRHPGADDDTRRAMRAAESAS